MLLQGLLLLDPAQPPVPGWLRVEHGRISEMGEGAVPRAAKPDLGGPDAIITPAFIDTHLHIPQFGCEGADGLPLLDWLRRVIFPAEAFFGVAGARETTRVALRSLVREGTLGFAGYLTSHAEASREAMTALERSGLRCAVGRVQMDREAPGALVEEDRTRAQMRPPPSPMLLPEGGRASRVEPSLNPRFAISCSEELLAEVGWAARESSGVVVQTHLAESPDECARVRELFPDDPTYTSVYDRFGLLTRRTLLAHCCHLSDEEWALLAERESVAVHCPVANVFLRAGVFNFDKAREFGVRVALGSDVAAGSDHAMPRVARAMIETAKFRGMRTPGVRVPTPSEAWSLITRGNADAMGWADAGRLEAGASADLLVLRVPESWRDDFLIGRMLHRWSSDLIESRVCRGVAIDPSTI